MKIDHVHFYVRNAARTRDWFIHNIGFKAIASRISRHTQTEVIVLNSACFILSSPLNSKSVVAKYLNCYSEGIVDIAFRVKSIQSVIDHSKNLGIKILQSPRRYHSAQGEFQLAQITGWKALNHTLIEVKAGNFDYCLPDFRLEPSKSCVNFQSHILNIDHIVLNVAQGKLKQAVEFYQTLFGFEIQQSFNIQTEKSGLFSQALIDQEREVQFNINEPISSRSQIQEFIDLNGGSGIQHLALRSQNLISDMEQMRQHQVEFMSVPNSYYVNLGQKLWLSREELEAVTKLQILVDRGKSKTQSLLMQIFTQPIFERRTFFLEFIERRQAAEGFGQGNFTALFSAVEEYQNKIIK